MINIFVDNTVSIISADSNEDFKKIRVVRENFKRRHPNFFFVSKHVSRGWDGYDYDINEKGKFLTGFLPRIVEFMRSKDYKFTLIDKRMVPEKSPNMSGLRDYQVKAVNSILNNSVCGIPFMRGIINAEMNAGKTYIMVGIFKSFPNSSGIILLNDSDLYDQFITDMPGLMGDDSWGYLRGKEYKVGRVMVVMVQTLIRRLREMSRVLSQMDIVCIDECDLAVSKTYKKVLNSLVNTSIRVGLSGTIFLSKIKKYEFKINPIIGFTGGELFAITSTELIKKGISSKIVVKFNYYNTPKIKSLDYDGIYKEMIIESMERADKILERVRFYGSRGLFPMVIVCRYHEHVFFLYDLLSKYLEFDEFGKITYVTHKTPNRKGIFESLKRGQINILISSLIIKRGKNIPQLKVIINAAGGDSPETTLQVLGRGLRTHHSKTKTYVDDFYDKSPYLERHSKHRINYYKNKNYKVILLNK